MLGKNFEASLPAPGELQPLGGAVAGPLYADIGYASNTVLSAAFVLIMGLIVWFFVPEPPRESD